MILNRRARRRSAAFTIVELMIAVLLSAIVLIAVYFVFISNTEQYYRQEQIVQMQETMRFALEHLKTDLRNAGRLTVVNGTPRDTDPGFCRPQDGLVAIELFNNEEAGARPDFPAILSALPNQIRPDRLRLLVDASGATPLVTGRVAGRTVSILAQARQPTRDARKIVQPAAEARFRRMFRAGHYLYITALDEKASDLVPISGVNFQAGAPVVTLGRQPCLPAGACSGRCQVNPVQLIEYALVFDPREPEGNRRKSNLERRVINVNGNVPFDDSRLVLAEHVIDLQIWGTYDTRAGAGDAPSIPADRDPNDDRGNWRDDTPEHLVLRSHPERVRALHVLLATRTPREDDGFGFRQAFDSAADRTWFDLDNSVESGLARVATLVSEVETPNIYRGVQ